MAVTSREELIQYAYRQLGAPLVEINMTDEQAEDNVDSCISFFRDYHYDGIEKVYLKHQIVEQNMTDGYITLPDLIFGVNRVFPTYGSSNVSTNIFDLQYQMRMNDLRDLTSTSIIYYSQVQSHMALIDSLLMTQKQFRWNKLTSKLYIDQSWTEKMKLGEYILVECYRALDPETAIKFYDDRSFKKYVTASFKRQWGSNVKKYSGITLPGNITLDGQAMYDEGKQEMEDIEEEMMNKSAPLEMVIG